MQQHTSVQVDFITAGTLNLPVVFLWKVDVKPLTRKKNHKCNHFNRILLGNKSQSVYLQFVIYIYSLGVVVWQECEASASFASDYDGGP